MEVYVLNVEKLSVEKQFQEAYQLVDAYRKRKVDLCKNPVDKSRSLGAGLLLAYSLTKVFQEPWSKIREKIRIGQGKHGKPYFDNWKGICFNLSHSGNYAVCAISDGKTPYEYNKMNEVGIDIQKVKNCSLRTGKRVFSDEEYDRMEKAFLQDEKKGALLFTRLWAERESKGKLLGTGVFFQEKIGGIISEEIFWKTYLWGEEYVVSLADYRGEFPNKLKEVSLEEIIDGC